MEKFIKWLGNNFLSLVLIIVVFFSGNKILGALQNVNPKIINSQVISPPQNTIILDNHFENELSNDGKTLKSKVKVSLRELPKGGRVYLLHRPLNSQEAFKEVELKNTGALHYEGLLEVSTEFNYDLEVLVKGDLTTLSAPLQKLEAKQEARNSSPIEISINITNFDENGNYTYEISAINTHNRNDERKIDFLTAYFTYKGKDIMQLTLNKDTCEVTENYDTTIFSKTGNGKVDKTSVEEFKKDFNITVYAESNNGFKYSKALR